MLDELIGRCLSGTTATHVEQRLSAAVRTVPPRAAFFTFRLDGAAREALGLTAGARCCDALLLGAWRRHGRDDLCRALVFVELKSSDVEHAVTQLGSTIEAARARLDELFPDGNLASRFEWHAVVVHGLAAPHAPEGHATSRRFRSCHHARLWMLSCPRGGSADLSVVFRSSPARAADGHTT